MGVVLIGYRGSGKSTVGKILADRLGCEFVDTDTMIAACAGKSISEIFAQQGEAAFRDLEAQIIAEVAPLEGHVIAIGGGALQREPNRLALRGAKHRLIYLRCDEDELLRRVLQDPATAATRPGLTFHAGGIVEIQQLLAVREPIYRQAMHAELDVTHLSPSDAAAYIMRLL